MPETVPGDVLLVNKKHKELLEGFEARVSAAAAFVQAVRPGLRISSGPLLDPKVFRIVLCYWTYTLVLDLS